MDGYASRDVFISSLCSETAIEINVLTSNLHRVTVLPVSLMHTTIITYLVEVDTPTQGMIKKYLGQNFFGRKLKH